MAMIYYRKGLDLALTHNDYFENQAQGYCNIGRIHLCQNENDLALDDLLKSLGTYRRVCEENDPRLKDTYRDYQRYSVHFQHRTIPMHPFHQFQKPFYSSILSMELEITSYPASDIAATI